MSLYANPLVSIFTADPATVSSAVSYIRIVALSFPFMGIELVMDGALVGAGDTLPSFVIGVILNFARLPMALLLRSSFGVNGVWIAIAASVVLKSGFKVLAFRLSRLPLLNTCTV
uniref:Polysaccharide biosynthesis protein C-terminal domain-containing protein n=1 Tax=Pyrodinium bahamense TaxID=73915 RepID=A0A7S0F9F8_9DINO